MGKRCLPSPFPPPGVSVASGLTAVLVMKEEGGSFSADPRLPHHSHQQQPPL